MPGFGLFDSLQITKRLGAMVDDAGGALKKAVTPKAPFPLTIGSLTDQAGKKAEKTARDGADMLEAKARGKASTLQDNTIGKVTTAVDTRVASEVSAVEKKVGDKAAAVEKNVDDAIAGVGKTVDGAIASANKSLDKALGRPVKDDDAPEVASAAVAEDKDGKPAPLASGWTKGAPTTRARSNAVTVGSGRARSDATAERPVAASAEDDDMIIPAGFFDEPGPAPAPADATLDEKVDENSDAAIAADTDVDVEGQAVAAARARQAAARAEAKDDDEDMGLAGLFGETPDDAGGEDGPAAEGPAAGGEVGDVPSDAELDKLGERTADDDKDQVTARKNFRKKIREINGQLAQVTGGGLALDQSAGNDPWLAYFVASAKFKKKLAVRDLSDELAGIKKDGEPEETAQPDAAEADEDKTDVVEEATGPENRDETEVEITGGLLRRGTASKTPGEAVDTTDPELGSAEGRQIFVADRLGKLFVAYRPVKGDDHAQLLGLDDVAVAGQVRVEEGKIDFMSNDQGGEMETAEPFVTLLRDLRDKAGIPMNFAVFEASKKNETTAEKLLEEADRAAPEPEQADLLTEMNKHDSWKLIASDFSAELITRVAQKEGWKVAGGQIVDATGPLDPDAARVTLQKAASTSLAAEAAAKLAAKAAAKAAPATVDA